MWPEVFFSPHECVFEGSEGFKLTVFHCIGQRFFSHLLRPNVQNEPVDLSWRSSTLLYPLKHTFGISDLCCTELYCHLALFG